MSPETYWKVCCDCGEDHQEGGNYCAPCDAGQECETHALEETCPSCGEAQGALGYCVIEGEIHSRYETHFVVPA